MYEKAKLIYQKHKNDDDVKELTEKVQTALRSNKYNLHEKVWLTRMFFTKVIQLKEF